MPFHKKKKETKHAMKKRGSAVSILCMHNLPSAFVERLRSYFEHFV